MNARFLWLGIMGASLAATMSAASTPAAVSDDQQLANSILLRVGDLPHGWKSASQTSAEAGHCLKPMLTTMHSPLAQAETKELTNGDVAFAASLGDVYKAQAPAVATLQGISFAKVTGCLGDFLKKQQTDNIKVEGVASGRIRSFPHLGERSREVRVMVRVHDPKNDVRGTLYIDLVFIQRNRALAVLLFEDFPSPLNAALEVRVSRAVGQRMKQ